ncbi:MAG: TIM44-like domain-containing protein, partial [Rhodobacteraceae bacterium]|nr:TIM44-like domain-containing protein [Paracoccaceae bacterium]
TTISCDEVLSSRISEAAFDHVSREAEITVDFRSRILVSVHEGDEEDDESNFVEQEDSWTFVRRMGTGDPNWKLVANS